MAKPRKRGMRRAYLKRFSSGYINTGRSLNAVGMDALFSGSKLPLNADPWLTTIFGKDTNNGGIPREQALALREKIINQTEPHMHFKVLETEKLKVLLFYRSAQDGVFFVQYEKTVGVIRKSISYANKERAMRILRADNVKWLVTEPMPSSS